METVASGQTATGWTVDDSSFGARLALVRLRMDWNLKEAAKECGLPGASWRTWERDGVHPRRIVEISQIVSRRTGCDFMWLLAGPERLREDGAITRRSSPLDPRIITRPPSRPRSEPIDSRPAIVRRRLAA